MTKRTLEIIKSEMKASCKAFNEAMLSSDLDATNSQTVKITELEKEYASMAAKQDFEAFLSTEKPMLSALEKRYFTVCKHQDVKDNENGFITRTITGRQRPLDFVAFEDYAKSKQIEIACNNEWRYDIQKLNVLLAVRAGQELHTSIEKIKAMINTFSCNKIITKIEMGETPTSNTKLLNALQNIVNKIIYEDGKKGNFYKVRSQDVAYLNMLYLKRGKEALSVSVSKHKALTNLIMDILHGIITGKSYSVEYPTKKN